MLVNMKENIGVDFLERTKYRNLDVPAQSLGYPNPPLQKPVKNQTIELPSPSLISIEDCNVREIIEARSSVRSYSDEHINLEELSYLLWCIQGVKKVVSGIASFRNVPSAGARHALETYIISNRVQGLDKGIYRFIAIGHKLEVIEIDNNVVREVKKACLNQEFVTESALVVVWSAVPYRMTWRYGDRGYRYLFLDAGHSCQNLYLSSESIGYGVCAIAAFSDENMNELIGIDGKDEFVIYVSAVGKKN